MLAACNRSRATPVSFCTSRPIPTSHHDMCCYCANPRCRGCFCLYLHAVARRLYYCFVFSTKVAPVSNAPTFFLHPLPRPSRLSSSSSYLFKPSLSQKKGTLQRSRACWLDAAFLADLTVLALRPKHFPNTRQINKLMHATKFTTNPSPFPPL